MTLVQSSEVSRAMMLPSWWHEPRLRSNRNCTAACVNGQAKLGVSLAEYIRRVVARDLGNPSPTASPLAIFDLGESGGSDIAKDKDRMLGQAFAKRRAK